MVGDSITAGWHLGKETTGRLFPGWDVVSLACSGDRVQDQLGSCLWGGLDGYRAKLVQVMVGTNNALENRPEDITGGIRRLVGVIREKQPDARILLMPIFPCRNRHAPGAPNLHREATDQVNALIRPLADGDRVVRFELYDEWLDERGRALPRAAQGRRRNAPAGHRESAGACHQHPVVICQNRKTETWCAKRSSAELTE